MKNILINLVGVTLMTAFSILITYASMMALTGGMAG